MPNWCDNELQITGPQADADALRALMTTQTNPFDFEAIVPVPDLPDECQDWSEWSESNWGTNKIAFEARWLSAKKAARLDVIEVAQFRTAWSPPTAVIASLSKRFPALTLRLSYDEPDWGFRGFVTYARGEMIARKHEEYCFEEESIGLWHSLDRRDNRELIYIGRERDADDRGPAMPRSKWANPFESPDRDPKAAVELFVRWIFGDEAAAAQLPAGTWHRPTPDEIRAELRTKTLVCLCSHNRLSDESGCPGNALARIACGWDGDDDPDDDDDEPEESFAIGPSAL
jgi:hypothetical protein